MSNKVTREREMPVSRAAIYEAITDFNSYPEFVSEVVSVKPGPVEKGIQRVVFELEIVKRFQYTLEFNLSDDDVSWKLVESNIFKKNDGRWRLTDKGPNATFVQYELDVAFGFLVPGWVTRKLTEVNLPKMLDGFEERAKKISKK